MRRVIRNSELSTGDITLAKSDDGRCEICLIYEKQAELWTQPLVNWFWKVPEWGREPFRSNAKLRGPMLNPGWEYWILEEGDEFYEPAVVAQARLVLLTDERT